MPCSDVTEVMQVTVDADDRLKDYWLAKRSCGRGVGAGSLLMEQLAGRSVDELLVIDAEAYLHEFPIEDELEEFLSLKHLFAIQTALEVLTGKTPGGKNDPCAAAEIAFEDGDTIIDARISIDLVTEKIESCGNCRGCGTKKKPKVVFN